MKFALFPLALLLTAPAFAQTVLQGECVGTTTGGRTVAASFCLLSWQPRTLVSCTAGGRGPAEVTLTRTEPDGGSTFKVIPARYSKVTPREEAGLRIDAADVPVSRLTAPGTQRVEIEIQGETPASMTIQAGPDWVFSFKAAQCSFEPVMASP